MSDGQSDNPGDSTQETQGKETQPLTTPDETGTVLNKTAAVGKSESVAEKAAALAKPRGLAAPAPAFPATPKVTANPKGIPDTVERLDGVKTGMPYLLKGGPADAFKAIRQIVIDQTGHDLLAVLGDALRPANYHSTKPGVIERSYHKTGRAIDVNQGDNHVLLILMEPRPGVAQFRVWLRCDPGFEKNGGPIPDTLVRRVWKSTPIQKGASYFDFETLCEQHGFHGIPAWRVWARGPRNVLSNYTEWWHKQFDRDANGNVVTFDQGLAQIQGKTPVDVDGNTPPRVLGLNDRGKWVTALQRDFVNLGLLTLKDVDGVFDAPDRTATVNFQHMVADFIPGAAALDPDGNVGPLTRAAIEQALKLKTPR